MFQTLKKIYLKKNIYIKTKINMNLISNIF